MEKIDTKEIFAIAQKSKWQIIKRFLKKIIKKTLKPNIGYVMVALDVKINGLIKSEYSQKINDIHKLKIIDKIDDFNIVSFYQSDGLISDHLNLSKEDNVIIILAKYFGPDIKYAGTFDFSIQVNSIDSPYFTNSSGQILNSKDIIEFFNQKKRIIQKFENKACKVDKEINLEIITFEELTDKKAIWGSSETISFKKWKIKTNINFRKTTGKNPYYRGKITSNYRNYLLNLKSKNKDKKVDKEINLEIITFEELTDKKAIWGSSETKSFKNWKMKTNISFRKTTGKNPYYRGKITSNYCNYLRSLLKNK